MIATDNGDMAKPAPPMWFDIVRTVMMSAAVFLIVSGNILCFVVVRHSTQMRKVSRIFTVSLAGADLAAGLVSGGSLLVTVAIGHQTPAVVAEVLCKVYFLGGIIFNGGSFLSLLALICDCYIAVEKPLRYPSLLTARRAYNIVLALWAVMLAMTSVYGVYFGPLPHHKPDWHWCLVEANTVYNQSYTLLLSVYTIVTVIVPLGVTLTLHGRIKVIVKRRKIRLAQILPKAVPFHHRLNDTKSLTTFLMINCGTALTSLPLSVVLMYSYWTNDFSMYGISSAMVLRFFNNLLNVLAHVRRNREFRLTARRVLGRRRHSPENSPSSNSAHITCSTITTPAKPANQVI